MEQSIKCKLCGKSFLPKHRNMVYCSVKCRTYAKSETSRKRYNTNKYIKKHNLFKRILIAIKYILGFKIKNSS